jgi:hypothetical protein
VIPRRASDLDDLLIEVGRQSDEVGTLLAGLDEAAALWRPDETRWSVTGHIAHLAVINDVYLGAMEKTVRAASDGPRSDGPYRHPLVARWFARSMEPPPKRRLKTFRAMIPDPGVTPARAGEDFRALQDRLAATMRDARGLDLGRVRFRSPFFALLRFSLGTGFEMLLAHNRRHVWLAREVMETPGFPGGDGKEPAGEPPGS